MTRLGTIVFLFLMTFAQLCLAQQGKEHKLTNVRWPDYDEEGNLVSELMGESAIIRQDGKIDITNLTMLLYEDGKVATRIKTPQCKFDKENMMAESDDDVKVERSGMVLSGTGFTWNAKTGSLEIRDNAKVVLMNVDLDTELENKE